MEKKLAVISMIIILVVTASGCLQLHAHLTIDKDGSGYIEYTVGLDSTLAAFADGRLDLLSEIKAELEKQGYSVNQYSENNYSGFKAKRAVEDIRELAEDGLFKMMGGMAGVNENSFDDFKVKEDKGIFFNKYRLEGIMDFQGILKQAKDFTITQKMLEAFTDRADFKFILTLPLEPELHNASSVSGDGKTLTWELVPGQENDFLLEVRVPNVINMLLVGVGCAALIIGLLYFILRKRH